MSQWKLVPLSKIDANRWDSCVRSRNGEVFAEFWYWNAVCKSWQAWVKGDYEDVIALPIERKWGIVPFMRTPLYVKWLEGDATQLELLVQSFFGFKRVHIPFEMSSSQQRQIQLLHLDSSWTPSKELAKNLRKAESEHAELSDAVGWDEYHAFMLKNHPYAWPAKQQHVMKSLYEAANTRDAGKIAGVRINGQWAAMQFYIRTESKAYLIQNAVSMEFRNREPMPFLLNSLFMKWQADADSTTVNFMGSNNAGVARFNEKFGAVAQHYWEYPH